MQILLIEDDLETAQHIISSLREAGHVVEHCVTGADGLARASAARPGSHYGLLIIDRMLPDIDGVSVARRLRAGNDAVPILFLTTLGGVSDRVEGLNAGGDDYLVKPFALAELLARIDALARRAGAAAVETSLKVADLEVDLLKRTAIRAGQAIDLQPREFKLLEYLMRHSGQIVTRTMLLEHVWEFHFEPQTTVVETHISRLRSKIDRGFDAPLLDTVRGVGYCLRDPG
ncbi:two-component system OmpR family response regulator [Inquilinus ginsengisoli]|uniref:Two-component system OmpR family response regulator n=1 Tax=Inquilinus ginsengisoli TaxID=363840 RepID=A0ABU1JVM3_9PROT|nr:response regulator transcription factor [Inquilinus ginsengisoli]MDR6292681.1 two-component system OmpR family response regulator [Inquilinus ginsengisoli]